MELKKVAVKFDAAPNSVPVGAEIEFEEFLESAERDSLCTLTPSARGARLKPDWNEDEVAFEFPENDETEYVNTSNQINHGVRPGQPWQPHAHIIQTHAGTPVFVYRYRLLNVGLAPTAWLEVEFDTPVRVWDPELSAMVNIIKVANKIDDGLVSESTEIQGKLMRKTGDGYAGDVLVTSVDVHYLAEKIGKTF